MSHHPWDEFSKSLAQELVPRRESLRRIGLVIAGAVFSPLGLGTAFAAKKASQQDPCKAFCKCSNKKQQNACLAACKACGSDTSRLAGSCGNHYCCAAGQAACGGYCTDLAIDPYNCGACGYLCDEPGPYEYGACIDGECQYACAPGAVRCDGECTFLDWDPFNCGACGSVCPESSPFCDQGVCTERGCAPGLTQCGSRCIDLMFDPDNCGACGSACPPGFGCAWGVCESPCYNCY